LIDEKVLIDECKRGDIEAFEQLIFKYQKKVFNITYRFLGDYNLAEDVSQEIFIRVFKSIKDFKGESSFYTWLYRITINQCMDMQNKNKKHFVQYLDSAAQNDEGEEFVIQVPSDRDLPEVEYQKKELRINVEKALMMLTQEQRAIIILRDIQGFSYEEISDILNCPVGTVKSRINRARDALKKVLFDKRELFLSAIV
jgi:RNA polymerase sigma-70 factor (ECF subfamily)